MRVLVLRAGPCARARVQIKALRAERPEIELALARQGGPGGEDLEREWILDKRPARGLREAIADFSPDLIHSHGPRDLLTVCAIELTAGRIPVLHDMEFAADDDLARRAIEESDALVVPTQGVLADLASRYTLPAIRSVFPSYRLERELPPDEHDLSAEANIGRIASLYELLVREPMAGIVPLL